MAVAQRSSLLPQQLQEANLTLSAYNTYRAMYPAVEVIGGMLWDTVAFVSAAINRLQIFNVARATPDLSNLETPGMLTNNKGFLIRAIRFNLLQGAVITARAATGNVQPGATDNLAQILNTGYFQFFIGSKDYFSLPLWAIPGGEGEDGCLAADGDRPDPGVVYDYCTNGKPSPDSSFVLSQPVFISPLINFYGVLLWPAAITFAPAANLNIRLTFDGDLIRPVQ
jgi:hypothetical protein